LQHLIENKPLISLKLQFSLPIEITKDNQPQSSNGIKLDYVFNPVLKSRNIDSMDLSIAKK
jgi:hypothetical protein